MQVIHNILAFSEVWALLIPLYFMLRWRNQPGYMKPVKFYIWLALLINIQIILIYFFRKKWDAPFWFESNNHLYNLHSLVRFLSFALFFLMLRQAFLRPLKIAAVVLFIIFTIVNFAYYENYFDFWSFSGRLLSIEAGVLLLFCLQYYFFILRDDTHSTDRPPSFWVVTGLSIYVVVNFPIFLFYKAMLKQFEDFAIDIWDVHNISYVIFCIFLARAFYESGRSRRNPQNTTT